MFTSEPLTAKDAVGAVLPWNSVDALRLNDTIIPQQDIEVCLMCKHCADACDKCDGYGNLRGVRGRPKKQIDMALLREMMQLRRCRDDMCAALGISRETLRMAKAELLKGEIS